MNRCDLNQTRLWLCFFFFSSLSLQVSSTLFPPPKPTPQKISWNYFYVINGLNQTEIIGFFPPGAFLPVLPPPTTTTTILAILRAKAKLEFL
jgi:hypothetical protein